MDAMKKAIVQTLVKENNLRLIDIENESNWIRLELDGVRYFADRKYGKVIFNRIPGRNANPVDFTNFTSIGDPYDSLLYVLKTYYRNKQETQKEAL